jgi:hypothetical protein
MSGLLLEQIELAKKENKSFPSIYDLFILYCREKNISIYSKDVFPEILKLFPQNENPKLYEYCLWMLNNQIDF